MDLETDKRLASLMIRSQSGDQAAYSEFLELISVELKPYLTAKVGTGMADDALQEILIAIHKARHTFIPSRPLAPWLFAIVRYKIADLARVQSYIRKKQAALEKSMADIELREDSSLKDALLALGDRDRKIVSKLKLEGYSLTEVAKQLSISESAVKVAAHRAYRKLKKLLWEGNDGL